MCLRASNEILNILILSFCLVVKCFAGMCRVTPTWGIMSSEALLPPFQVTQMLESVRRRALLLQIREECAV